MTACPCHRAGKDDALTMVAPVLSGFLAEIRDAVVFEPLRRSEAVAGSLGDIEQFMDKFAKRFARRLQP